MVMGAASPRFEFVQPWARTDGPAAVKFAARHGLQAFPWQEHPVDVALGVRQDGSPSAKAVALCVPRQNGKGGVLEILELYWLFVQGVRKVIHSAHEYRTAQEAFDRMEALIRDSDELMERMPKRGGFRHANGEQRIELATGERMEYRTRTKTGGRGLSGEKIVLDEAMIIPDAVSGALIPILSAQSMEGAPQILYTGSAVDETIHEYGRAFSELRAHALAGDDPDLSYMEWSAHVGPPADDDAGALSEEQLADVVLRGQANPLQGVRISPDWMDFERRRFTSRVFATERLGIGKWTDVAMDGDVVFDIEEWVRLAVGEVMPDALGGVRFGLDMTPDRSFATIGVAGSGPEWAIIGVADHRAGSGWVIDRAKELQGRWRHAWFAVDAMSAAASLAPELTEAGVDVRVKSSADYASACGRFFDAVDQRKIRYVRDSAVLDDAVRGAVRRGRGDAWFWDRRDWSIVLSPLVSVTLAYWEHITSPEDVTGPMVAFA